eukprot:TRINITY_DN358_c0_g1_i1.p1 TRINITY_DN358_c0_g1~~TRINITY_DN358_c0_g1_i1.p1  ORF type:complete len:430 (-),score=130.31 TRINITY_DN358_c0_g1_i1:25-1314(-)
MEPSNPFSDLDFLSETPDDDCQPLLYKGQKNNGVPLAKQPVFGPASFVQPSAPEPETSDHDWVKIQQEQLLFWEKQKNQKVEQKEQKKPVASGLGLEFLGLQPESDPQSDFLLALKLQQEEEERTRNLKRKEEEDSRMALLMYEQEKRRSHAAIIDEDEALAKQLQEEEERKTRKQRDLNQKNDELSKLFTEEEERIRRKEEIEKQDAEIARRLFEEEQRNKKREELEERDRDIARRIQLEEKKRKDRKIQEERDAEIARKLYEEEKDLEKKQEMERKMSIKQAEADRKLSKLMAEKQELERKLREVENSVVLQPGPVITLADVEYPNYWDYQNHPIQRFNVAKNSSEWYRVSGQFIQGLPQSTITKIQRIQNQTIWMWYFLKRKQLQSSAQNGHNERMMFHGSLVGAYDIIIKEGFDHRVAKLSLIHI